MSGGRRPPPPDGQGPGAEPDRAPGPGAGPGREPDPDPGLERELLRAKATLRASLTRLPLPRGASSRAAGERAASVLAALPVFVGASRVGLFWALPDELPTRFVHDRVRRAGKTALLPRVTGPGRMELAAAPRWEALVSGPFGTRQPGPAAVALRPGPGDLVLVPGVAFDRRGGRVGRGGGFYDRLLPRAAGRRPVLLGFAHSARVVDEVPGGAHDLRVRGIVTERGVIWCPEDA